MSSDKKTDDASKRYCAICKCFLPMSSERCIQEHNNGKNHKSIMKKLDFIAPMNNKADETVAATKFAWEENFDADLLSLNGITICTLHKETICCKFCECALPDMSISHGANVYNTKIHVLGIGHRHYTAVGGKQFKITDINLIFKIIEAKVKFIFQTKGIDFSTFEKNKTLIAFAGRKKYFCKLCDKYFPVTDNITCYYNVLVHLVGRSHKHTFKGSSFYDKTEYNALMKLGNKATLRHVQIITLPRAVYEDECRENEIISNSSLNIQTNLEIICKCVNKMMDETLVKSEIKTEI